MKTATFTIRADVRQSARWKRAAEAEGYASVGQWAALALDAHLEARTRAGRPLPLAWSRGRVPFRLLDGTEVNLPGWIALPFGFIHGTPEEGPIPHGRSKLYTLTYIPTRRFLGTFRRAAYCKALAADLSRIWVRWDGNGPEPPSQDPAPILDRHQREAL